MRQTNDTDPYAMLDRLGVRLEAPRASATKFVPVRQSGALVFVAGQVCRRDGELVHRGKVGSDVSVAQAQEAARQCAVNVLSVLDAHLGDLARITQFLDVTVVVNSAPGFVGQPQVADAVSDFLTEVFGEVGQHARMAIGANELPLDTAVEVKVVVEVAEK